ncbi:MAG: hypothetical protein R3D43_00730 [Tepidamorphaceae bacterium]|nr:hypothetical protein [Rhodobiaceae bacterium]
MQTAQKHSILAATLIVGLGAFVAVAKADCAQDVKTIEAAMAAGNVDKSLHENTKAMLDDAMKLQKQGKEARCVELVAQIKASLGLNKS